MAETGDMAETSEELESVEDEAVEDAEIDLGEVRDELPADLDPSQVLCQPLAVEGGLTRRDEHDRHRSRVREEGHEQQLEAGLPEEVRVATHAPLIARCHHDRITVVTDGR